MKIVSKELLEKAKELNIEAKSPRLSENAKKVSLCIHEPNTTLCKKIDCYREF